MMLSDKGGGDFQQAPAGTHVARCIKLIDIGTQFGEYEGKPNSARKIVVAFELPTELMTEGEYAGKPFIVNKYYTASLGAKATLRKDLVNWRGREFTPEELMGFSSKNILGKPCMIQLTPNKDNKVKVTGVMAMIKGAACPPQINDSFYFSLERDEFQHNLFDSLPDYYKDLISKTPEWKGLQNKTDPVKNDVGAAGEFLDDDIPF